MCHQLSLIVVCHGDMTRFDVIRHWLTECRKFVLGGKGPDDSTKMVGSAPIRGFPRHLLAQKIECPNYFHQLSRLAHHFCCSLAFSAFMRQQKLVLTRTDQVMSESSANEFVEFILSKGGLGISPKVGFPCMQL